ncbi:hypothetical protein F4677DRAFT_323151 [Hypoxylon crocopeplum]|nr:hypothetical protein F4677DRAFT_323151 [Hypoxylon crocopeplum]
MNQGLLDHVYWARLNFGQATNARLYRQDRWWTLTHETFAYHLNRHDPIGVDEVHQFRLKAVILEATEINRRTNIGITRDDFESLLLNFEIPISSTGALFHDYGGLTQAVRYDRDDPRLPPISICICMQTPSLDRMSFKRPFPPGPEPFS